MLKNARPLAAFSMIVLGASGIAARAQEFPAKPVRLVVNFPPGGPSDAIARPIAQKATEIWNQPVVVDFRGGAAGNIGADHVAKSPPDGYTVLLISGSFLTNPALAPNLPFDPIRDFAPVTPAAIGGMILVANPAVPAKSVKELVELARKHPGKLTFASSGAGGSLHLNAELLKLITGISMLHVPYKGAGPALIEVVGGQVDMMFVALVQALQSQYVKERFAASGVEAINSPPDLYAGYIKAEIAKWTKVVKQAGIRADR